MKIPLCSCCSSFPCIQHTGREVSDRTTYDRRFTAADHLEIGRISRVMVETVDTAIERLCFAYLGSVSHIERRSAHPNEERIGPSGNLYTATNEQIRVMAFDGDVLAILDVQTEWHGTRLHLRTTPKILKRPRSAVVVTPWRVES